MKQKRKKKRKERDKRQVQRKYKYIWLEDRSGKDERKKMKKGEDKWEKKAREISSKPKKDYKGLRKIRMKKRGSRKSMGN